MAGGAIVATDGSSRLEADRPGGHAPEKTYDVISVSIEEDAGR